jgi:hypothetical protein
MGQALQPDPRGDWLRMLGGVLLAIGAVILFARKTEEWAAFPLLLVAAIPCIAVFALGALGALATGAVGRWHAVLMVTGVLLSLLMFGQFWDIVGIDTDAPGFGFLLFLCTTVLAVIAAFAVGAAYQAFLAALAGIGTWLFFWEMLLDDPSTTAFRWLLLVICVLYLILAFALRDRDAPQGPEFVTAAGIAGVLVGTIGLANAGGGLFFGPAGGVPGEAGGQSFIWDVFLLLFSLGLVAYAAAAHVRGPAYVGFVGLLAFTYIQGIEINALLEGDEPDSSVAGWPLILLLVGAAALALGMFIRKPPPAGAAVPAASPSPDPETTYDVRS